MIMPNYIGFAISERMLQDYLDIFRGYNTRPDNLAMPYDHPFFDENGNPLLQETPCIEFILVGEARPPENDAEENDCGGDRANTYFYNKTHIGIFKTINGREYYNPSPWLNAPRLNWVCPLFQPCPNNKVHTLLCLASQGVLLLDLFPFPIPYGPIRQPLNDEGVTRSFWDDPANPYSLSNRIIAIQHLLCNNWDLCLIAPPTISAHIVNPINGFLPLAVVPAGSHPINFRNILPDPTRCALANQWRKVAVSSAGFPTSHLINVAF
jgi:hypothetical protein